MLTHLQCWRGSARSCALCSPGCLFHAGGTLRHGCRRRGFRGRLPCPAVLAHDRLPPRFDPNRHRRPDRAGRDGRLRRRGDRDPAAFTAENLARFRVVVFLMTTGDPLDDRPRPSSKPGSRRAATGSACTSAADTEYDWPFYGQLVGAYFKQHPAIQQATVNVEVADSSRDRRPAVTVGAHRRVVRLSDEPACHHDRADDDD